MNGISSAMGYGEDHEDAVVYMIGEMIGQVAENYTRTMIACNRGDRDQVWRRYAEGVQLEEDLNNLTKHHLLGSMNDLRRFDITQ